MNIPLAREILMQQNEMQLSQTMDQQMQFSRNSVNSLLNHQLLTATDSGCYITDKKKTSTPIEPMLQQNHMQPDIDPSVRFTVPQGVQQNEQITFVADNQERSFPLSTNISNQDLTAYLEMCMPRFYQHSITAVFIRSEYTCFCGQKFLTKEEIDAHMRQHTIDELIKALR